MRPYLLITSDADLKGRVIAAVGGDTPDAVEVWPGTDTLMKPVDLLARADGKTLPEVVVFGPDIAIDTTLALAADMTNHWPYVSVLLMAEPNAQNLRAAMRVGVHDVLDASADGETLRSALLDARDTGLIRPEHIPLVEVAPPITAAQGRIIVVVSPKGGTGKTTIATNLAVGLAEDAPRATVIVDLDVQFGDVASALRLSPDQRLTDFVFGPAKRDIMVLKSFLTEHSTDLYAVCAPETPGAADRISGEDITHLLEQLAGQYRFVIVDTPAGFTEHTLAALDCATDVVFVVGLDVPSIRGLRKELDILAELGIISPQQHVVVNNADARAGVTLRDVEKVLGRPVDVVVPPSRSIKFSTNNGIPVLAKTSRGKVAKALRKLVTRVSTGPKGKGRRVQHGAEAQ